MDYLLLNEMKFFAFHGVNEQERIVGNTYLVSLKLGLDMSRACQSDQLEDTLNYASVYKQVAAVMKIPCNLIEHLAEKICLQLRNTFPEIQYIEIRLKKCHPPIVGIMQSAEIILERWLIFFLFFIVIVQIIVFLPLFFLKNGQIHFNWIREIITIQLSWILHFEPLL